MLLIALKLAVGLAGCLIIVSLALAIWARITRLESRPKQALLVVLMVMVVVLGAWALAWVLRQPDGGL